jgi:BASS family bile acid:Na+ symporter
MVSFLGPLRNSSFIFTLAVVFGLGYPGPAHYLEPLITPALLMMMVFSMVDIDLSIGGDLKGAMIGFGLNYILLSGLILVLSSNLGDEGLRQGFVVMAAVPPAIAVLPLTKLLDGDSPLSLYAEALCYLASLILMPGIIFAFTSRTGVSLSYISEIALLLILLPAIASRFLRGYSLDTVPPINLGFFLVTYTVVGLNSQVVFGDITSVALIAIARTFVIGVAVYLCARLVGVEVQKRISYTLFASFKNLGMAAAVSLVLFGPKAGIPAAVCILAETSFYILFAALRRHGSLI